MPESRPSSERHRRVKDLFLEALQREPEERETWLARECGDEEDLAAEVRELLGHHETEPVGIARRDDLDEDPGLEDTGHTVPLPNLGRTIGGRYRLVERIGEGGMAEVFKARDLDLDQTVALKLIRTGPFFDAEELARNEVRLARRVTHPNVCRVFDVGRDGGDLFVTMELVDGEDLGALLRKVGRLPEDRVLAMARQLCAGLAAAHAEGILHRDLKPSNILIDATGRLKITDFGIAIPSEGRPVTQAGTPAWMAPELLRGHGASERSDLYALALVLYRMAMGRRPPRSESGEWSTDAATRPTGVDRRLEEALITALSPDPAERPRSVLAFAATLPGMDPLGLASEAGLTPPADVVAAASDGRRDGTTSAVVVRTGLGLGLLVGVALLGASWSPLGDAVSVRPPAYLAERTGDLLRELGYPEPVDRAWGFFDDLSPDFRGTPVLFWYRESPSPLVSWDADNMIDGGARVDPVDPPLVERGMSLVLTDGEGRIVELEALAPDEPDLMGSDPEGEERDARILRAVGVSPSAVSAVEPVWVPRVWGDRHNAWEAPDPRREDRTARVEAVTAGSRVVWIRVEPAEEAEPSEPPEIRWDLSLGLDQTLLILPLLLCLPVARRHFRRGRSDGIGAARLVGLVLGIRMVEWALGTTHVLSLRAETLTLLVGFSVAAVEAATVGVVYLALEPWVRRDLPRTLVGWRRALAGRVRDPVVGRAVLAGVVAGPVLAFLVLVEERIAALRFGFSWIPIGGLLDDAVRVRDVVAGLLRETIGGVYLGILLLLLLVALRRGLRRGPWAHLVFVGLVTAWISLEGQDLWASWLLLGLGTSVLALGLLTRFGLLSTVTAFWVREVLLVVPLTLDTAAWFFVPAWASVGTVAAIAVLAGAAAAPGRSAAVAGTGSERGSDGRRG